MIAVSPSERGRCSSEFGFPATLYWTTYYSLRPYAVFDPMLSYLLWKGRERHLQLDDPPLKVRLQSERDRSAAFRSIYQTAKTRGWTAAAKEDFLVHLSDRLGVDYGDIKKKRILHMISPEEAAKMYSAGTRSATSHAQTPRAGRRR